MVILPIESLFQHSFKTKSGESAINALFQAGPLERIFDDEALRLAPAKGKTGWEGYSTQTYYMHVLSVAVTAANLFEADLLLSGIKEEDSISETTVSKETLFRVLCAAAVLHDINKIVDMPLQDAVRSDGLIRKILGDYLLDDTFVQDVKFLVLSTEGGDSGFAIAYKPSLPGPVISKLQTYLEVGDRLSGYQGFANGAAYSRQLSNLRSTSGILSEIHVLTFVPRVQSLLTGTLRRLVLKHLAFSDRRVLHEGTDFISYIGAPLEETDFQTLDDKLIEKARPSMEEAMEQCVPTHNRVPWTWAEQYSPTPDALMRFIKRWKGRLVLWEGRWFNENAHILASSGLPFKLMDGRPRIVLPDEDDNANANIFESGFLAIACCLLVNERGQVPPEVQRYCEENRWPIADLTGLAQKTALGLAWAASLQSRSSDEDSALNQVLQQLSDVVSRNVKLRPNPLTRFTRATLLTTDGIAPRPDEVVDKRKMCYQCQGAGTQLLEAAKMHGIGAQSSTGIKLTKLSEGGKGRLCEWCAAENALRNATFGRIDGGIAIHIHLADFVPDIPTNDLFRPFLKLKEEGVAVDLEKESVTLLPKGRSVRMDGHMTIVVPMPLSNAAEKTREGAFLKSLYFLSRSLGLKVHATSLIGNPSPPMALLFWETSPAWAKLLGLNESRAEQIVAKSERLNALLNMGHLQGGGDGFGTFAVSFQREPLHVYYIANRALYDSKRGVRRGLSQRQKQSIKVLEEAYMDEGKKKNMEILSKLGVGIAPSPNWSANEHRWVMQEALRGFEQARALGVEDGVDFVAAQISTQAQRFLLNSNSKLVDEKAKEFAQTLREYLAKYYGGEVPYGMARNYLINHYAYEYRQNYRIVRPKEDTRKDEEK